MRKWSFFEVIFEKINAIKNAHVVMYVTDNCSHCKNTKAMFNDLGIDKFIVVNNAKDHLDYLKSENIKYIPFLKSDSGKHEGAVKDIDDLIAKLNIVVKSDAQDQTQDQTVNEDFIQSDNYDGSTEGYVFKNANNGLGYYKDKVSEPVADAKKPVKESYKSSEQHETNMIAHMKQPQQIINNRGMLNESAVDHFVETYVPNYKDNNYLTKTELNC